MSIVRWPWFVGSIVLCLLIAYIYILRTPPVYNRQASVLIKEETKGNSISVDVSQTFADMGFGNSRVNVYNEIVNFSSPDLMTDVVKRLNLETSYRLKGGLFKEGHRLYDKTLYGSSLPLSVKFLDLGNSESASFRMAPAKDEGQFVLSHFTRGQEENKETVTVALGDTVETLAGRLIVSPTAYYNPEEIEGTILVNRGGYYATALSYLKKFTVALHDKNATVLDLTMDDVNIQRATDVINMVINVYNENWIKDKNLITTSTNEFIADRLRVIEKELGDVDSNISDFKSRNRMPDILA